MKAFLICFLFTFVSCDAQSHGLPTDVPTGRLTLQSKHGDSSYISLSVYYFKDFTNNMCAIIVLAPRSVRFQEIPCSKFTRSP